MQKTATPPIDLVALEQLCQQQLQERFPQMVPLQARCYLREETLVLTLEHHPPVLAYPHQAFRLFEQLLEEAQPAAECTGLIYLRIQGQQQPYAFHIAKVKPPQPDAAEISGLAVEELTPDSVEEETTPAVLPLEESFETEGPGERRYAWLPIIAAGTGFGVLVFCLSLYLVSRPCVLRSCPELDLARKLAREALDLADAPPSGQAVLAARNQLARSQRILKSIPPWSGYRPEARGLLAGYQKSAAELDGVVAALQGAARAGNLTQNPPLPLARWQEAQTLWQSAISQLQQLPADSEFNSLAPRKLTEYKRNLRVVEQGLESERDALENLNAAREMAKTAEVRQGLAQNFEHLRLVETMWAQVSSRLQSVPKSTTSYLEAQQALRLYLPQISATRDRKSQELDAREALEQAETLAKNAKTSESNNQWSEAVKHWREAISTAETVSDKTFAGPRAKTLIETYTTELNQAEVALQNAIKLQQIRSDLAQICTHTTKICNFSVDKQSIQVYLSPTYVQQVRSSAARAQSKRDTKMQVQLLEHVYGIERALNAISDSAGLPLAVYDGNTLVQSHRPKVN